MKITLSVVEIEQALRLWMDKYLSNSYHEKTEPYLNSWIVACGDAGDEALELDVSYMPKADKD